MSLLIKIGLLFTVLLSHLQFANGQCCDDNDCCGETNALALVYHTKTGKAKCFTSFQMNETDQKTIEVMDSSSVWVSPKVIMLPTDATEKAFFQYAETENSEWIAL